MSWITLSLMAGALLVLPGRRPSRGRLRDERSPIVDVDSDDRRRREDPLAIAATFDLLAACLRSGLPVAVAAEAVSLTAPPPLSESLRRAADLLSLGADAATAWESAASDPATESLARMARRSARSGSSLAGSMTELATESRTHAEDSAAASAERAGVLISGPLGLCFLPAFICLGIVPVVIGLASRVVDGGLL
ncbi:type II secretion system F family protein [Rhodococcus tibetensis]|uniref:Type II secretion system F family protein n=1 Tax=Rhodococcus tibetensis TaxID=2965064 RepID=A0ABT1QKR6_9NOCA|nr:type II secretion system F family protein [Rhodococcus sp. FXJ9.536]MCQ4121692.1 type II secretion system F family protein [Rhodococcus sp. FXJ9.536]